MSKGFIWVVDDDSSIRWVLEKTLTSTNMMCESFGDAESVIQALERNVPDVIISDIRMPGMDGLSLLHHIQENYPELPVIIMTAHSDLDAAVSAYQKGAFEYLPKPFDIDETLTLVERALAHSQEQKSRASILRKRSIMFQKSLAKHPRCKKCLELSDAYLAHQYPF